MPPTQENPSPPPASKRTNCGRLTYRFSYAAHKVTLQTPCFEPTCNTCARAQPAVAAFEDSPSAASPPPHYQDVLDAQQRELVRRRRERCEREVGERLRRVGELAVANAAAVKVRSGGAVVERRNGGRYSPRFRRRVALRFERRLSEYRRLAGSLRGRGKQQQQQRSRRVVLKFERREAFARLSRELAAEGRKLFLVIGKNDTLRCRWE